MSYQNAMRYLQKNIFDYSYPGIPYELISALVNARSLNTSITERDTENGPGKKRPLKINYRAPICDDDGTCSDNICDPGKVVPPKQAWFEISRCTASDVFQINKNDLRYIDGNWTFSEDAMSIIRAALPTIHRKLATEMAALLTSNAGCQPNGNDTVLLPWVDKNTGAINPIGLWEIERVYRDTGYQMPFIVGGSDVFYWRKAVEIGGLNNMGQNIARLGRTNAYYDNIINTAFADPTYEHTIAFDPNLIKLVTFSENAGIFSTDLDNVQAIDAMYASGGTDYIEGTLVDPVYDFMWDFDAQYSKCGKFFTFQLRLNWDIFFMPNPICNPNGVTCVNGIFHFLTCAPTVVECPVGSPVVGPSSTVFNFSTSGITFPYFVDTLTLAGQTTMPGATVTTAAELATLFTNEISGYTFTTSGANIRYTGYQAISGVMNDNQPTEEAITFA